jgi:hypothetical protein
MFHSLTLFLFLLGVPSLPSHMWASYFSISHSCACMSIPLGLNAIFGHSQQACTYIPCWVESLSSTSWADPGLNLNRFLTKPSKYIEPPGKPGGSIAHSVHCVVSLKIVLWVTTMLKCLHSKKEWGSGIVFHLLHGLIWLFNQLFLRFSHLLSTCMHYNKSSLTIHSSNNH